MRHASFSALALSIAVAAVAACESGKISDPQDGVVQAPAAPMANANLSCHYLPDGETSIPVIGGTKKYLPVNGADCAGAVAVIGQGVAGDLGFANAPSGCGTTQVAVTGAITVRRCLAGPGVLKIYTDFTKTTIIQQIGIDRNL